MGTTVTTAQFSESRRFRKHVVMGIACVAVLLTGCVPLSGNPREFVSLSISDSGQVLISVCTDVPSDLVLVSERLGGDAWSQRWELQGDAYFESGRILTLGGEIPGMTTTILDPPRLESSSQLSLLIRSSDDSVSSINTIFPRTELRPGNLAVHGWGSKRRQVRLS